jgi:arylsulfatase
VIHSWAKPDGTQKIELTGALTKKRMETVDEEFLKGALDFMDRAKAANKPFFLWFNSTRMHIWTHLKKESEGKTGLGITADGMVEHDGHVGQLLKKLDDLGLADNTIVMYSTDNGAETFSWPDGGTTRYRGEKATNWEGGWRVPALIRWPGVIKPGQVLNGIGSHEDMLPTLLAAAGDPNVKEDILKGMKKIGNTTYKAHIDGYNLIPWLSGQTLESPRKEFLYWSDDGTLLNLRYNNWKLVFQEQRAHGFGVWQEPFETLRLPKLFNLRMDPFERADHEAFGYHKWRLDRVFMLVPAQAYVFQWLSSFKEFPPRLKPASFSLEKVMEQLASGAGGGK